MFFERRVPFGKQKLRWCACHSTLARNMGSMNHLEARIPTYQIIQSIRDAGFDWLNSFAELRVD